MNNALATAKVSRIHKGRPLSTRLTFSSRFWRLSFTRAITKVGVFLVRLGGLSEVALSWRSVSA